MDYVPDFTHDRRDVWIAENGRYFVHDFTLYPQWYFEGTYYMPFVTRRPNDEDLEGHEYALAWYDIRLNFRSIPQCWLFQFPQSVVTLSELSKSLLLVN